MFGVGKPASIAQQLDIASEYTVDYEKAIQNLTDILIDRTKFNELQLNLFKALDQDNIGLIEVKFVEDFTRDVLKGK